MFNGYPTSISLTPREKPYLVLSFAIMSKLKNTHNEYAVINNS